MVNVQKAITAGIKYTQNGCRLLGKTALKDCSVQIAEVETHFGRGCKKFRLNIRGYIQ